MELRQLAYFVSVAREQSFTRAAQRLHVAQPGISQQIRRLEAELGVELLERSTRQTRLTPAGTAFLPHARRALDATEAGRTAVGKLLGVVAGRLRLGIIPGIPHIDVPGLLAGFVAAHPRVEISLREDQPLALLDRLRHDHCDAVIVGLSDPRPPAGVNVERISVEPLVLVTARDHTLTTLTSTSIDRLRDEAFVTLTPGSALRRHVEHACELAGFTPRIALETSDVQLLCQLVARGLGVTIVPQSVADASDTRRRLRLIPIEPAITDRHTALAWRSGRPPNPATDAFLSYTQDWLVRSAPSSPPAPGILSD